MIFGGNWRWIGGHHDVVGSRQAGGRAGYELLAPHREEQYGEEGLGHPRRHAPPGPAWCCLVPIASYYGLGAIPGSTLDSDTTMAVCSVPPLIAGIWGCRRMVVLCMVAWPFGRCFVVVRVVLAS